MAVKTFEELSPKTRQKITDMVIYFNQIMAKKTEKGTPVHSFEYAIEKCAERFYFKDTTCHEYIKRYSDKVIKN